MESLHETKPIMVAVLVPVYGVERWMEKCARSLFEQTMQDGIEFIFTDDCSPDGSIAILERVLEEYPQRKPQVRILHHEVNQGLPVARLTGLHAARGRYVIHCDSDDWVEPAMYQTMLDAALANDAEIVGCDFIIEESRGPIYRKQNFSLSRDEILASMTKPAHIGGFLWNRMIRKDFYLKGGYRADKGITLFEDLAVTFPMHKNATRVSYVPQALYHYNKTLSDSLSILNEKHNDSGIKVLLKLIEQADTPSRKRLLEKRLSHLLFLHINSVRLYNPDLWREKYKPMLDELEINTTCWEKLSEKMVTSELDKLNWALVVARKLVTGGGYFRRILCWIKQSKQRARL